MRARRGWCRSSTGHWSPSTAIDREDYTEGLGNLLEETTRLFPDAASFSSLTYDQQLNVLTAVEETPFFNLVRTHTITGFFAHPVHGGNHDKIGWQLVNYDDSLDHKPPFGYYDARPATPPIASPFLGPRTSENRSWTQFTPDTEVDFVVIGSGAAGGIMAKQLSHGRLFGR